MFLVMVNHGLFLGRDVLLCVREIKRSNFFSQVTFMKPESGIFKNWILFKWPRGQFFWLCARSYGLTQRATKFGRTDHLDYWMTAKF